MSIGSYRAVHRTAGGRRQGRSVAVVLSGAGSAFPGAQERGSQKPLLAFTLHALASLPEIEGIVLVAPDHERRRCEQLARAHADGKLEAVVRAEPTRLVSVHRALGAIHDAEFVLLHHGSCALTAPRILRDVLARARETRQAASAFVELRDTIVRRDAQGRMAEVLESEHWVKLQSPQAFPYALISRCHQWAAADGGEAIETEAELLGRYGHPVHLVRGSHENLQMTTREEALLARLLVDGSTSLARWQRVAPQAGL
jgi:2-C-methyl-D-erythritol 4-phosphate cytidylyltransferase